MSGIKRLDYETGYSGSDFGDMYVTMAQKPDGDYVLHSDHEAEVARLRAEVDAYRKDAERYRWLRDTPWFDNYEIRSVISHQQNAVWDETIDAAMGASA